MSEALFPEDIPSLPSVEIERRRGQGTRRVRRKAQNVIIKLMKEPRKTSLKTGTREITTGKASMVTLE